MSLVFYSGGHYHENSTLNQRCIELSGRRTPKVTFIPASSEDGLEDFRDFVDAWDQFKTCQFVYFPIDYPYSEEMRRRAFNSDVIFLSGGNTYYFLKHLKENGLMADLANAHQEGRIIAGLSAGAIIMTPTINTAGFPHFDCDENFVGLKTKKALNFVNFEIFPHYMHTQRYRSALKTHSKHSRNGIFALPDASGIIATPSGLELSGPAHLYVKGNELNLSKILRTNIQNFSFVEKRKYPRFNSSLL